MGNKLVSVFHVEDVHRGHANLKPVAGDPLDIYLLAAVLATKSFAAQGWSLSIITNAADRINARLGALLPPDHGMSIIGRDFSLDVPKNISFRGSHFKLDLLTDLGAGVFGDPIGFIDVDVVAVAPIRIPQLDDTQVLMCDVTQRPQLAEASNAIVRDIARLGGGSVVKPRWFGGEFVYGSAAAFRRLADITAAMWPRYKAQIGEIHNTSDEMLLNTAVQGSFGLRPVDSAAAGVLQRWWSVRSDTQGVSFAEARKCSILHLPADKEFLAAHALRPFDADAFLADYTRRASRKLLVRRIYNGIAPLIGKQRRFVARMR